MSKEMRFFYAQQALSNFCGKSLAMLDHAEKLPHSHLNVILDALTILETSLRNETRESFKEEANKLADKLRSGYTSALNQ